ncbi:MAG TPA: LL-diaminopimelate aminotransferase [Candidatus Anaerotruncus excrementipullorum]|uniref:LL-diaminopimelate aminotransferase n=1 Tax=Candidatus Anaerotruncus excrementipullorum TaxID=2838465 RepID=A0A9D1WRP7_9FIRM|nr:LL-diaminopimelate aminotransferase [Candidatus Anaerotruncus excrementipullorum]
MKVNEHFQNLGQSYLFTRINQLVAAYQKEHPDAQLLRMGIGDVTQPLVPAVVEAIHRAAEEMGHAETFHGYGPEQGYPFLREAIARYYAAKGVEVSPAEIFVSDGAKNDLGNLLDIFAGDNVVAVPDPVYPAYVDTNVMDGRPIRYLNGTPDNQFLPGPPDFHADLIYLCSPNNPTGAAYDREQLAAWVEYALAHQSLILYDAAYEGFLEGSDLPSTIFQIPGARRCAIEVCSLSKTAGFTGMRCGYTTIPLELEYQGASLHKLWGRRQATKHNGVSFVVQRAAEAVFSPEGMAQTRQALGVYRQNARLMADTLRELGIAFWGGIHSPYLWMRCPGFDSSWDYFSYLLENAHIIGTPGEGFGSMGEGFFRLSAFGTPESTRQAMEQFRRLHAKN